MDGSEIHKMVGGCPLFKDVTSDVVREMADRMEQKLYDAGQAVFTEGDPGDDIFFIHSGSVGIEADVEDLRGTVRKVVVREFGAGDIFGEGALLTGGKRGATVRSIGTVIAFRLARKDFEMTCRMHPQAGMYIYRNLAIDQAHKVRETSAVVRKTLHEILEKFADLSAKRGVLSYFGL